MEEWHVCLLLRVIAWLNDDMRLDHCSKKIATRTDLANIVKLLCCQLFDAWEIPQHLVISWSLASYWMCSEGIRYVAYCLQLKCPAGIDSIWIDCTWPEWNHQIPSSTNLYVTLLEVCWWRDGTDSTSHISDITEPKRTSRSRCPRDPTDGTRSQIPLSQIQTDPNSQLNYTENRKVDDLEERYLIDL